MNKKTTKSVILVCPDCGREEIVETPCPYTGWNYSEGWVVGCPDCRAELVSSADETIGHKTECERVLKENE